MMPLVDRWKMQRFVREQASQDRRVEQIYGVHRPLGAVVIWQSRRE
jgi:hypothetical protein